MKVLLLFGLLFLAAGLPLTGLAQTTRFTYQGQLSDSGTPQATYQMRFGLYGVLAGGSPIGSPIENAAVAVDDGIFSVVLDFGANPFPGADRYLEISVRRDAGESYTVLSPRQQISSAPYAIRTLSAQTADEAANAQNLGGVPASEYVTTSSNAFIRNGGMLQHADFNIDGNGFVGGTFGVGTTTIDPNFRFDVLGTARVLNPGAAHYVAETTGDDGAWARYYMRSNNRSWFIGTSQNFNGNQFYIADEDAPPAGAIRMAISTGGFVGINNANPQSGLDLGGTGFQVQQRITDNTSGNSLVLQSGAGGNLKVTGYNFSTSTAIPLYLSTDGANTILNSGGGNVGIGTTSPNAKLAVVGSATQDLNSRGFPKAMLFVLANTTISRCYNGTNGSAVSNGSTSSGCGFSVSVGSPGAYEVTFPFNLSQTFLSVSTAGTTDKIVARISGLGTTSAFVRTWLTSNDEITEFIPSDFFLMVY